MKPKIVLLATIDGIKAEGDYDHSDQIVPYYFFSNDSNFVIKQIEDATESLRAEFGGTSLRSISESRAIVFLQQPFENSHEMSVFLEKTPPEVLSDAFSKRLTTFVHFLWLVKDSSASVGNIYCILNSIAAAATISTPCFSNCKGNRNQVTFKHHEITSTINILGNYTASLKARKISVSQRASLGKFSSVFRADESRLSRALLMLQVVRQSEDTALKVAHFCSCFEILFSSATGTEIAHQLAERIAFFIAKSAKERITIYSDIRDAYRVRCEIFHGRFLKLNRQTQLEQISIRCDELLRNILLRILETPECAALFVDKPEQFDKYFNELVLGLYAT